MDSIAGLPEYSTTATAKPFQTRIDAVYPTQANGVPGTITATVGDGGDGSPFTTFVFQGTGAGGTTGASYVTPILWGYELYRPGSAEIIAPGKFAMPVNSVSVSGIAGPDPREERGQAEVKDLLGEHAVRLSRGILPARVVMDHQDTEGGTKSPIVLARGYVLRPKSTKKGRAGSSFPNWRDYNLLLSGVSDRVGAVTGRTITYQHFAIDPAATPDPDMNGAQPAWKVTDVIAFLLKERGFLPSQVIVPDLPQRLWGTGAQFEQDSVYDANTDVIAKCVAFARNYLGAYLIWDANGGPLESVLTGDADDKTPIGAWRIVLPPPISAPALFDFRLSPTVEAEPGTFIPDHSPAAYADDETFIIGDNTGYTIPPECNHVWVFTSPPVNETPGYRFERHVYNPRSYRVPGMANISDPDSPHYLGFEHMYVCPDANLFAGTPERTQFAVDFTARRILDYSGRARRVKPISAPLVLVRDDVTGRMRPLRYYDPVAVNGDTGWYVRSVNPSISSPNHRATYEIEKLIPLLD